MCWPDNILDFLGVKSTSSGADLNAGISYALTHLDKTDKRILLLKFTCGYDDETIAKTAGVSKQTVSKALDRAKKHMLSPTVLPLIMFGKEEGLQSIADLFELWEKNPTFATVDYLALDLALHSALNKAGCMSVRDVLDYGSLTQIKGVGPKYAKTLAERIYDLKLISEGTNSTSVKFMLHPISKHNREKEVSRCESMMQNTEDCVMC